jgi:hypothetical protein
VANFNATLNFVCPVNAIDGIRRSVDTDGTGVYIPDFIDGMAQYGVRQMTSSYAPASGISTTAQMIPSTSGNNWASTHTGTALAAWHGGILVGLVLYWMIEGHSDNGGSFNGLFSYDFTPAAGVPTGGALVPNTLSDIDDVPSASPAAAHESYSDGRIGARHSYHGWWVDQGTLYIAGGGLYVTGAKTDYIWSVDPSTGTWTQVLQHSTGVGTSAATYHVYDATSRKVFLYKGSLQYQFFDCATQTVGTLKNDIAGACELESGVGYDPTRDRVILIGESTFRNWTIDWSAETVTENTDLTFSGATAHQRRGISIVYHPTRDTFICVGGEVVRTANGDTYGNLYEFDAAISDPSNVVVTTRALGSAMTYHSGMRGTWKRIDLIEAWDVLVAVTDHDEAPYIISLTDRT